MGGKSLKKLQPPGGIGIIPMDTQAGIKHSQGFFPGVFFPPLFFPTSDPAEKSNFIIPVVKKKKKNPKIPGLELDPSWKKEPPQAAFPSFFLWNSIKMTGTNGFGINEI